MSELFVNIVLYIGVPYALLFSVGYIKRVQDPKVFAAAFNSEKFTTVERYGYLVFAVLSMISVVIIPPGFWRCVVPAAGLGVTNALSSLNRQMRVRAFLAYFSAIFISLYFFSGLKG
ncbi:MAG: hypothetical protein AB8C84_13405 [Oligoflexales bacterium]